MYPMCDSWAIGPVAGWSYDQVRVSTKATTVDDVSEAICMVQNIPPHGKVLGLGLIFPTSGSMSAIATRT